MCVALDIKSDPVSAAALLAGAKECMRDGTSVVVFKGEDYVAEDSHAAGEGLADGNLDDATDRDPPVLRAGSGAKEVIERPRAAVGEEFDHEEGRRQLPGGHDEVEAEAVERGSEASGKAAEGGLDGTAKMEVEKDEDESGTDEDSDQEDEEEMKRRRERKRRRHKRKWAGRKRELQAEAGDGEGEQMVAGDDDDEDGDAQTQQVDDEEEAEPRVVGVLVARVVQCLEHMRSFSRVKVGSLGYVGQCIAPSLTATYEISPDPGRRWSRATRTRSGWRCAATCRGQPTCSRSSASTPTTGCTISWSIQHFVERVSYE